MRIDSLAAGGDGVGRVEGGRVVFVPFTAPGDLVRVRLTGGGRRFARGRIEELVEEGDARTQPVCAVFGACGGCAWQHVDYATQVEAKARILEDALARLGGIAPPEPVRVTPSPSAYGYRSRSRVLVRGGRVGFRRLRSHALCATDRCPVLSAPLQEALTELARAPGSDGERELVAGTDAVRVCDPARRDGSRVHLAVGNDRIGVSPGVFSQANAELLETLARAVWREAGSGELAVEAFAGAGCFTLGLARRFARLIAIESHPAAAADLAANLEAAAIAGVEIRDEPFERAIEGLGSPRPEVVVLDPPRAGLPPGTPERLAAIAPPRIVYLSCDPATLARDASRLVHGGYVLRHLEGFDLFPQTPHVEALAVLELG